MIPKTLGPVWNKTFWSMYSFSPADLIKLTMSNGEPASQEVKVWVLYKDMFCPADHFQIKMSNVVGSKEEPASQEMKVWVSHRDSFSPADLIKLKMSNVEPASQEMKVWVSDKDMFSPSDLIKLKMSNVVGSKELVGRCMVSLAPITSQEPEAGKGMGRIQLTCLYRSLGSFKSEEVQTADKGILSYRMIKITKLGRTMTITAILKVNDEKFVCGPVTNYQGGEHVFYFGNTKDFYGVPYDAEISLQVFQRSLTDVAMSVDHYVLEERNDAGFFDRAVKLEEADGGVVHMQLRYMPYF
eukprot:gene1533-32910_t